MNAEEALEAAQEALKDASKKLHITEQQFAQLAGEEANNGADDDAAAEAAAGGAVPGVGGEGGDFGA